MGQESSDTVREPCCEAARHPCAGEPSFFHNGLLHLYRGEMQRHTLWRQRQDATTHWAILTTAGMTTFALGSRELPHYILLLGLAINAIFLVIEARRYQHMHHSRWRVQMLEHNYFAQLLEPAGQGREPTWRRQLYSDLEQPHFTISWLMAARLRLRRNYLLVFLFITAVWLSKIFIHPGSPTSVVEYYERFAVGGLFPSWFVVVTATLFVATAVALAALTPSEEELERWTKRIRTEMIRRSDVGVRE